MRICLALAMLLALVSRSVAQDVGDAAHGQSLALVLCAHCHAVRPGHLHSPNGMAPSFGNIATTLGMNERALRVWFASPHPTMPDFVLNKRERNDLIAYIMSLRTQP